MKFIKPLAVLLPAVMLLTLSGCAGKNQFASTSTDKKVVMKLSGENVEYQEYRYFFLNNKRDQYGEDAELTADEVAELQQLTAENLKNRHTLNFMADDYGVKLTKEDEEYADVYVTNYRASCGSDEGYLAALKSEYMTDKLFRDMTLDTRLAYALLEKMKADGAIKTGDAAVEKAFASDEIICIKEIYVDYPSEELRDWAKGRIDEALDKLEAGGSFEALMEEYSSYNNGELPSEHGYYTMKYDALDEVWTAAEKLEVGEHSGIIESPFGFHIVLRSEKDADYMEANRDAIFENYTYSKFYEQFYKIYDTLTPEFTDYGSKLDFAAMK